MEVFAHVKRVFVFLVYVSWVVVGISGRPSSVNVGALFTFDSAIGRSAGPAIAAAIQDVNSDARVLHGTRLVLVTQDTNCSGFIGTVEGTLLTPLIFISSLCSSFSFVIV